MGFFSYNESYYRNELEKLEHAPLTRENVYHARQLLKMLDDLTDEGYTELNDAMESGFACLTRLRAYIRDAGETPFPIERAVFPDAAYGTERFEVVSCLDALLKESESRAADSDNPFLRSLAAYCDWIGYEEDTAYVFLLRDALLPYLYYKSRGRQNLYPWLISRSFLKDITQTEWPDDEIRGCIYAALEEGCSTLSEMRDSCARTMPEVLARMPNLESVLRALLNGIPQKRIVVVESGYCGTVPMLLAAMDERVSFRLYTAAPFLNDKYGQSVFCNRFEDIRRFETLYSQDLLLRYVSFSDGLFHVTQSKNEDIRRAALSEIKTFTRKG